MSVLAAYSFFFHFCARVGACVTSSAKNKKEEPNIYTSLSRFETRGWTGTNMPWEDSTASYIFSHDLENAAVRDGEVDVVSQAVRAWRVRPFLSVAASALAAVEIPALLVVSVLGKVIRLLLLLYLACGK
jgi:hypothetical protein